MKVVLISKSDTIGGAAIVTYRLMNALRDAGVDARMLVAEKNSDSEFVDVAAPPRKIKRAFLAERLKIFIANGFNRKTLFKIDTGANGVNILRHPWVQEADTVCLNWINQGFVSIKQIRKIQKSGKKIIWTMHDMWNMTGICHHAFNCKRYLGECSECPLLGKKGSENDLSNQTWHRKRKLYKKSNIKFVAVSNWLANIARNSALMHDTNIVVIPNAFPFKNSISDLPPISKRDLSIIFGAARLDDPIKGLPTLKRALEIVKEKAPDVASSIKLITFGEIRNPKLLKKTAIKHEHLGPISKDRLQDLYENASMVLSASDWETLPGTLVEGAAYGCIPIALHHGGQADIIDHLSTGWLSPFGTPEENAQGLADGIIWAASQPTTIRETIRKSAYTKFNEAEIAKKYIEIL